MDEEGQVVEDEKYPKLYDPQSCHYKDNGKKYIAWQAIALEIGSSGAVCGPSVDALQNNFSCWC